MFYHEMELAPYPRELLINPRPADPNDKSTWPQISGKVTLSVEHREALHAEALAIKKYPDPLAVLLHSSTPYYLVKEDGWREKVQQAVRNGQLIHRDSTDTEVEEFIKAVSADWYAELAKKARNTCSG